MRFGQSLADILAAGARRFGTRAAKWFWAVAGGGMKALLGTIVGIVFSSWFVLYVGEKPEDTGTRLHCWWLGEKLREEQRKRCPPAASTGAQHSAKGNAAVQQQTPVANVAKPELPRSQPEPSGGAVQTPLQTTQPPAANVRQHTATPTPGGAPLVPPGRPGQTISSVLQQAGPQIGDSIIDVRLGMNCEAALSAVRMTFPALTAPIYESSTEIAVRVSERPMHVPVNEWGIGHTATTFRMTCVRIAGASVVATVEMSESFARQPLALSVIENRLKGRYGRFSVSTDTARLKPWNRMRYGRLYSPQGLYSAPTTACGDLETSSGQVKLGPANANPLRVSQCAGALFLTLQRNEQGDVVKLESELWHYGLIEAAAMEIERARATRRTQP